MIYGEKKNYDKPFSQVFVPVFKLFYLILLTK